MSVGRICTRDLDLADPSESVQTAARRMNARNVGTLIVQNDSGKPVGIITDRDLAVRVVGEGLDAAITIVADAMTRTVESVSEETPI